MMSQLVPLHGTGVSLGHSPVLVRGTGVLIPNPGAIIALPIFVKPGLHPKL